MAKNVNRVDHIVAMVPADQVSDLTAKFSQVLQTAFYTFDRPADGVRVVISHDAGFELIAPLASTPEPMPVSWLSAMYGVRELDVATQRLESIGHEPIATFDGISGVEPYCDRYFGFNEAVYDASVFAGLPLGFVQADERPDSRMAGPQPKNVNRLDHIVCTVPLEGLEQTVDQLGFALNTAFYGPYDRADGMRVAASWDAGIVLLAPLDPTTPATPALAGMGFGVRDLDKTVARLSGIGLEPTAVSDGLDGNEPWVDRFATFRQAELDPADFGGLAITLTEIEEHPDQQNQLA